VLGERGFASAGWAAEDDWVVGIRRAVQKIGDHGGDEAVFGPDEEIGRWGWSAAGCLARIFGGGETGRGRCRGACARDQRQSKNFVLRCGSVHCESGPQPGQKYRAVCGENSVEIET